MSKQGDSKLRGVGLPDLLGILFIGLKLTGYINWSWWWVLSPLWGGVLFVIAISLITAILRRK